MLFFSLAVGDLYVIISQAVNSNLYAQTWGCQRDRCKSYCPVRGHKVYNVESITSDLLGKWGCGTDHSKWCVSESNDWTCIADSNRAKSQFNRPGGALCIDNHTVKEAFRGMISKDGYEKCPQQNLPEK